MTKKLGWVLFGMVAFYIGMRFGQIDLDEFVKAANKWQADTQASIRDKRTLILAVLCWLGGLSIGIPIGMKIQNKYPNA
jgi:hypothetical protein